MKAMLLPEVVSLAETDSPLRLVELPDPELEREVKSVANVTRQDIREFLPLAARIPIRPEVTTYSLEDANRALLELKHGAVKGAKVLVIGESPGSRI